MATNLLGVPNSNVFVPYTAATKRTKVINTKSTSDVILIGTGITTFTVTDAYFYAYADSTGKWRFAFNVACARATGSGARTSAAIRFSGSYPVVFLNTTNYQQPVSVGSDSNIIVIKAVATANTGDVTMYHSSSDEAGYCISGDCELNAEPTWAAANMEGVMPVDVFVPSATGAVTGLLDYRDNILCKYYGSTSSPGTSSPAVIKFGTKKYETYSSDCYSASTGFFTAPRAGYYRFTAAFITGAENYTTGSGVNMYLYTNSSSPTKVSLIGSTYSQTTYSANRLHVLGTITIYLAAGGTAAIYATTPGGSALDLTSEEHNWLCIERVGF